MNSLILTENSRHFRQFYFSYVSLHGLALSIKSQRLHLFMWKKSVLTAKFLKNSKTLTSKGDSSKWDK